ncbi:MAG TPA: helix-turn-helix domain-containing protein, partial [Pelomicrobium sp.]|nr:helix-turn-helix domain-containing protein [Pelomicrobium sp.]
MDRADSTQQHPAPDEVGRLLAETREAYGLSLGDVASRLRLSPRQIEALEAEDYERLPGKTFIRGFVRNYARLLQMDPAPLLAALEHALPESRASEILPRAENIPFSTGKPDTWRRYLLLLVLLLVVIPLVLFEAYRDRSATEAPLSAPAPLAVPPLAAPVPPPPAAPAADSAAPAADPPGAVAEGSVPP